MARAIKALREQAGPGGRKLSTLAAAANIGRTRQTWEKYENAKADVVLRQDVQSEIARALGVTRQDLLEEFQRRLDPTGGLRRFVDVVERQPPTLEFAPGTTRRLMLQDDCLRPWASSGNVIVYDLEQWPQPEQGCVIETDAGEKLVKIFVRADAEAFHVAEISPARREFAVPRLGANAYRVVARLG